MPQKMGYSQMMMCLIQIVADEKEKIRCEPHKFHVAKDVRVTGTVAGLLLPDA